eukprot:TRINITY_DN12142_c0_g1_i1.p1 TRINITY_DN12142_c0_g1~~TRINITY_DN12142_c0_g1_i1.p1  ORF type:complete len:554 (+),score=50.81 TRINITY_DN12142_c0_g1_i1:98-1663(+)
MAVLGRLGAICDRFYGVEFSSASWASREIGNGASAAVALLERRQSPPQSQRASTGSASSDVGHSDKQAYAVKIWDSKATCESVVDEVSKLVKVQGHPHVARLLGVFNAITWKGERGWLMMMENYPGGDLSKLVSDAAVPEAKALKITEHVLQGLVHIHSVGIIHRDVKLQNVVIAADDRAVLVDFGVAVHVTDMAQLKKRCGTPGYIAPEILTGLGCVTKSDVFSCGVVLYGLLSGVLPFLYEDDDATLAANSRAQVDFSEKAFSDVSDAAQALIRMMLQRRTRSRPSAREALRHLSQHVSFISTVLPGSIDTAVDAATNDGNDTFGSFQVPDDSTFASSMRNDTTFASSMRNDATFASFMRTTVADDHLDPARIKGIDNSSSPANHFRKSCVSNSPCDSNHDMDHCMSEETRFTETSQREQLCGSPSKMGSSTACTTKVCSTSLWSKCTTVARKPDVEKVASIWSRIRRGVRGKAERNLSTFSVLPMDVDTSQLDAPGQEEFATGLGPVARTNVRRRTFC